MIESLMEEVDKKYPDRTFLTIENITEFLGCSKNVVQNWMKRAEPSRRPPRLIVGNQPRFPKKQFILWLAKEQSAKGGLT